MTTRQRQHLPAEERRLLTVQAVLELAAVGNPGDITTAAIASHMNLTQGALFRHFPSKEVLWETVMKWVSEQLLEHVDQAAASKATPLATLKAMYLSHIQFVIEHPGVPRMMFGELQNQSATPARRVAGELMQRYAKRISSQIDAGKRLGEIDRSVQSRAAAVLFIGSVQGLVMQNMLSGDVKKIRRQAPAVFDLYQRGLKRLQGSEVLL